MTARGFHTHLDERLEHGAHVGRVAADARRELAVGPGARAALAERKVRLAVQLAAVHERADSAASHTHIPARPDPSETRRDAPKKSPTETRRRAGQCGLRGARDGAVRTTALSHAARTVGQEQDQEVAARDEPRSARHRHARLSARNATTAMIRRRCRRLAAPLDRLAALEHDYARAGARGLRFSGGGGWVLSVVKRGDKHSQMHCAAAPRTRVALCT